MKQHDGTKKLMKTHSMMQSTKEKNDNMRLDNKIKLATIATSV
jgi:hypothetical protein